jgi:hypothetical protein
VAVQLDESDALRANSRHRTMCDRPGCNRRDLGGQRRDARAALVHAHSAVSAHPHRDDANTHHDGADLTIDDANTHHNGADLILDVAGALYHRPIACIRTASRLANPKRPVTHLAVAAAHRICLLDWSDHGPPFQ